MMTTSAPVAVNTRKKLIEVALPLDDINRACIREKSIRHGHPSTLHLWWARRPLAAARAIIFSQMVDDPSARPELFPTARDQEKERQRLFNIIRDLIRWESTTDDVVLERARNEIRRSWRLTCADNVDHPRAEELFNPDKLPGFHDPFAGGGALPLEAQRLGLDAFASDINPVAVLINKAMIEIPPRFGNNPPISACAGAKPELLKRSWSRAQGLAEDVRYYGKWMCEEANKRIGQLYPKVHVTSEMSNARPDLAPFVGQSFTVIAWLWARTVKSPNPAFAHVDVPLASTFILSSKPGKEAYVEPVIDGTSYTFTVKVGKSPNPNVAKNGTKSGGSHSAFKCLLSGVAIPFAYLRDQAKQGQLGYKLMAVVADGPRGRIYLSPNDSMEKTALAAPLAEKPQTEISHWPGCTNVVVYGLTSFGELFTERQLAALTTFSDLIAEARNKAKGDGLLSGLPDDGLSLDDGGMGADAYADALAIYLAFVTDKCSDYWSSICSWNHPGEKMRGTFGRQALPMVWDFAEANPFSDSTGNFMAMVYWVSEALETLPATGTGACEQADAVTQTYSAQKVVSTDPPYFDNVPYADLSDFFYIWLRRALRNTMPKLFATVSTPKEEELVAKQHRQGGKQKAKQFFLDGMAKAMHQIATQSHPAFRTTIYYAFKQVESDTASGAASTGWDAFLEAVIRAGFAIGGTWPIRTEFGSRIRGTDSNALASSILLVCEPRSLDSVVATRREFVSRLKTELPLSLAHLQRENIAPTDLAQAAIGPGMAVFTRYARVVDAEGKDLNVRDALGLINAALDEALAEQEGDFDSETRLAISLFEQSGFEM